MSRLKRVVGRTSKLIVVSTIGFVLVVLGIALIPGPGPGLLLVIAGLAILSTEYDWARRLMTDLKDRLRRLRERASGFADGTTVTRPIGDEAATEGASGETAARDVA